MNKQILGFSFLCVSASLIVLLAIRSVNITAASSAFAVSSTISEGDPMPPPHRPCCQLTEGDPMPPPHRPGVAV